MSLEQVANANKTVVLELPSITVKVRPLSTRNLLRILGVVDKIRTDMQLSREDLEKVKLDAPGVTDLFQRIFNACVGKTDYGVPGKVNANASTLFTELAVVLETNPDALLDADVDDLTVIIEKFWEVNSSGPLGQRLLRTTETLRPMMTLGKDVILTGFQQALIKAVHAGGMTDGGQTGSYSPSTES